MISTKYTADQLAPGQQGYIACKKKKTLLYNLKPPCIIYLAAICGGISKKKKTLLYNLNCRLMNSENAKTYHAVGVMLY